LSADANYVKLISTTTWHVKIFLTVLLWMDRYIDCYKTTKEEFGKIQNCWSKIYSLVK